MNTIWHLVLNGISSGAVYAALGLSLVIIYRATRVVNFAQPALALISAYLAYATTKATGSYWLGFAVALLAGTLLGVLVERLLIRRVSRRSELSSIIVTLGLLLVLQAVAGMIWSNEPHAFGYAFDFRGRFSATDLFAVSAVLVTAAGVLLLFKFTPLGLRMRAAAFRPEVAKMLGVRVGLMLTAGWGLAALVGSLAGMLAIPPFISPNVLDKVFVFALTAAVLGGLDNPVGTIVGGFALGIGLSCISGLVGPELVPLAALAVLVLVLAVRPSGLFGRTIARRV
ncbi:branched-chain amino acid ABC transporter permease [Umezawaea beigongshangensis]|uniref:branched-chain amino acid ABC transporter permease n=1 Tax=Umezawaea beigongshangensis TaxID=2780383 RepID=UPI0018F1D9B5|nr:branched-chain amino acid ABC transporter permease [Umezawaea beigongshangensis]